jgi:uncharacterized membrane protein YkvA (DUF1232 family)
MYVHPASPLTDSPLSLPADLQHHLTTATPLGIDTISAYIERGAELVTAGALAVLLDSRDQLHAKIAGLTESAHLRRRLHQLACYFDEACRDGHFGTRPHREVAFALLYFLKGADRIPDAVPQIGLLDDAVVAQIVYATNETALRAHWLRHRRAWAA